MADAGINTAARTTLRDVLEARRDERPASAALGAPERGWLSYNEACDCVDSIATRLTSLGVRRGDAVAVVLNNGPEMALAFLAVSSVATCAPLNPLLTEIELDFYLDDLGAVAVVVDGRLGHAVVTVARQRGIAVITLAVTDQLDDTPPILVSHDTVATQRPPRFAADCALVLHTSGTTARPKIVPLSQANLLASADNIARSLALDATDRCGNIMPLFHIHGLMAGLAASLVSGGSVLCTPGFFAPDVLGWFDAAGVTWTTAVPTMHQALLERAQRFPRELPRRALRFLRSSSSALAPQLAASIEIAFGAPVVEAYGMTEAAHQICCNPLPPGERRHGSVGLAAGPHVAVLSADALPAAPGQPGEVAIRGANVTDGYVSADPAINQAAFHDGWFRTGDIGRLDDDGYLWLTGRLKELINRGGEKVAPREIDEVLLDHPLVAQAVCFAVRDARLGEQIAAIVVPRPGTQLDEHGLRSFAAQRLAPFKVPRRIIVADTIPVGPTGKPQRLALADALGLRDLDADLAEAPFTEPRNAIEHALVEWWQELLGARKVSVFDHFLDLGGDSMLAAKLLARVRRELGVEVALLDFFDAATVASQAALLCSVGEPASGGE